MGIDVSKLIDIIKDPDLKIKINDLYGENIKLKEENYELKKKLDKLAEESKVQSKLIHENNHYFVRSEKEKDGPFCTKCWDVDHKLVRLHVGNKNNGIQYFTCPNCKNLTSIGEYVQQFNSGGTEW